MLIRSSLLAFILLIIAIFQMSSSSVFAQEKSHSIDTQKVDKYVLQHMQQSSIPGVAIAITKGDEILYLKGYGVMNSLSSQQVSATTPFFIGSVSKTITNLAIMQLVDKKKVELDKPVQTYLPWFQVVDAEASKKITVRNVLTHTSGIPNSADFDIRADTLEERMRNLKSIKLTSQPGSKYEYAGPNYQIAALVVEKVSGISFEEYVQQNIFTPLEMKNSFTSLEEAEKKGLSAGHQYFFGKPIPVHHTFEQYRVASGQMISSAEDLSHFLIMHMNEGKYNGTQIVSPESLAEMFKIQVKGEQVDIGLTWRLNKQGDIPIIWHGGTLPNFVAEIFMAPQEKWGVVVLGNSASMLDANLTERITRGILQLLHGKEPSQDVSPLQQRYLYVLFGSIAIIGMSIWKFVQEIRSNAVVKKGEVSVVKNVLLPGAQTIVIPCVIIWVISKYLHVPISVILFQSMPDVMLIILISILIDVAKVILHSYRLYKS